MLQGDFRNRSIVRLHESKSSGIRIAGIADAAFEICDLLYVFFLKLKINRSFLGTPLSRMPLPTLCSFSYACAVSICVYPASNAQRTALTAVSPDGVCQVPKPTHGIFCPFASVKVSFCESMYRPSGSFITAGTFLKPDKAYTIPGVSGGYPLPCRCLPDAAGSWYRQSPACGQDA